MANKNTDMTTWRELITETATTQLDQLDSSQTAWLATSPYKLLVVQGPDAETFLQGQCTCNLTSSAENNILLGAHCNPQGRMLSSFHVLRINEQGFALRVHESIAEQTYNDLKKYSVFSKADLEIDTAYTLVSLHSPQPQNAPAELKLDALEENSVLKMPHGFSLRFSASQYELWLKTEALDAMAKHLHNLPRFDSSQWDLLSIQQGLAEVREQTRAQFLPQDFNFQLINGVSFKKGCYTGQEIIARVHYKATLKKHLYRASVEQLSSVDIGTELYLENRSVGRVVFSARQSEKVHEILALCNDTAADSESVTAGPNSQSFLRWQALPYAIP